MSTKGKMRTKRKKKANKKRKVAERGLGGAHIDTPFEYQV